MVTCPLHLPAFGRGSVHPCSSSLFEGHREGAQGFRPAHGGVSPTPRPRSALAGEEHRWLPKPSAGGIAASPRLDLLQPCSRCTAEQMETFGPSVFGAQTHFFSGGLKSF